MKICPKCQSDNVYVSKLGVGYDSCVKVLQIHNWMVSTQAWETHIYTDCGYYENYILNKEWLEKIKSGAWESWRKAD
jgi:hypothetical protein